jgi:hypothetical protein
MLVLDLIGNDEPFTCGREHSQRRRDTHRAEWSPDTANCSAIALQKIPLTRAE